MEKRKSVCVKCSGSGYIAAFSHIADGVCFACGGTGEYSHPATKHHNGVFEVVNEFAVWQFAPLKADHPFNPEGGKTDDLLLQAISGSGRKGKTLFRIRLIGEKDVEVGRKIYAAAKNNINPDDITNEWLGFVPGRCQVVRNRKGVSFL